MSQRKTKNIVVRITEADLAALSRAAEADRLALSTWVRLAALRAADKQTSKAERHQKGQ